MNGRLVIKVVNKSEGKGVQGICAVTLFAGFLTIMGCRRGDTIVMCSFIRILILSAGLLTRHTHIFSSLMIACVSSPPCSPKSPKPIL